MAILSRVSAILVYCVSTHFLLLVVEFFLCDSGNLVIRDSRFSAPNIQEQAAQYLPKGGSKKMPPSLCSF